MYYSLSKRAFDFIVAACLLVLLAPLMLVIYLCVRRYIGAPALFAQDRPGLHENIFRLYKFRTMTNAQDMDGKLLADADRLTPFGRWLRSTSLDELPELINVLKGEMSLVGPRPLLVDYLPYYTEAERVRHSVKPGLTGWAQINGRNAVSWEKKFSLDAWYVQHASFWLDIKIILLTALKIIKREGINSAGEATMSRFDLEVKQKQKS